MGFHFRTQILHFFKYLLYLCTVLWKAVINWLFPPKPAIRPDQKLTDLERRLAEAGQGVLGDAMVVAAQSCLRLVGFPTGKAGPNHNGVDGVFGPVTRAALTAFQKMAQIAASGGLDVATFTALKKDYLAGLTILDLALAAYQAGVKIDISREATTADFVNAVYYYALNDAQDTKVPAAVTTAQAILESNYGRQVPVDLLTGKYSYNLFGIKGKGPAGSVSGWTREFDGATGRWLRVVAQFEAYNSFRESIQGHSRFLMDNPRYREAFTTSDPALFAKAIAHAGYATDPNYAASLIRLMQDWGVK